MPLPKQSRTWLLGGMAAIAIAVCAADAATLPVKRVILSSSGLAQIEREGTIDGNAEVTLPVPLDQVDDILKSLAIFDSKGRVESVRLAGKEPLAQEFRSLPFAPADLDSPDALLAALRGAEVSILGPRLIRGRIVSVVAGTEKIGENNVLTQHRLTVLTSNGLESIALEEAQQVAFTDPGMQAKLDRALSASLDSRAKEERSVSINLTGQGSRTVSLSYVVTAPIWKTSYRLMLSKEGGKAMLQGWAVLENLTGSDWDQVELAIVSGNPVTLHQALYESYFVQRPNIPVQVFGQVKPRSDQGAIAMNDLPLAAPAPRAYMPMSALPSAAARPGVQRQPIALGEQAAASAETGAQISFRFPQPITVAAGQSLMAPFIGREMPVERVWLYQPDVNAAHPLTAIRIVNDSDAGLPAGILTVFEGDRDEYAGDAEFPNLPHADSRMISYALDQKTLIDRRETSDELTASLTAEKGIIRVLRRAISDTVYSIKAPADAARVVIIEQPKRPDFQPEDSKGLDITPTQYRLRANVGAGETKEVHFRLIHPLQEEVRIADLDESGLEIWLDSAKQIGNRAALDALADIAKLRRAVADAESRIGEVDEQVDRIRKDQERLRSNLGNVPRDSDLAKRYLETLSTQETELASLSHDRAVAEQSQVTAKTKLGDAIATVKF